MEFFLRIYLPIITVASFDLSFIWSSIRVYGQTGINPLRFGKEDNTHNYVGLVMKIIIAMLLTSVFLFAFSWNYRYLLPIWYLEYQTLDIIGLVLLHVSLAWILFAQAGMGKSWRIGVDTENNTELVTAGIFSNSRNPIFLGMLAGVLGIFLIIPNMISFSTLILSYFIINIQIRIEEEFLATKHGQAYAIYRQNVGRWF